MAALDLCRRLGTCLPDSANFEVNEQAIAMVPGLTGLETFFECLVSLGYQINWDDLGRIEAVQSCCGVKGARKASCELNTAISSVVRERNKIAHSGQSYAELTEERFEVSLILLETTAKAIVQHLQK